MLTLPIRKTETPMTLLARAHPDPQGSASERQAAGPADSHRRRREWLTFSDFRSGERQMTPVVVGWRRCALAAPASIRGPASKR